MSILKKHILLVIALQSPNYVLAESSLSGQHVNKEDASQNIHEPDIDLDERRKRITDGINEKYKDFQVNDHGDPCNIEPTLPGCNSSSDI